MATAKSAVSRDQGPKFGTGVSDDGKFVLLVRETDGSERPATPAECAEQKRRFQAQMRLTGEQIHDAFGPIASGADLVPGPTSRYLQYVAWKKGRAPGYDPTMADLFMLAAEDAREVYGSQDTKPGGQSSEPEAVLERPLHRDDKDILRVLAKMNRTMSQQDLEAAMHDSGCRRSRSTIGRRLKPLRDHGLVRRPHGDRGGDAITERGRQALELASAEQ